jgi:hypothetical protein
MNWIESSAKQAYIHPVFTVKSGAASDFARLIRFRHAVSPVS